MKNTSFVCFLAVLCMFPEISARERFAFTHVTVDEGLSNNHVEGICQDRLGRMWIATNDGINCYDGYELTIYKHDPDNIHTIQSNIVNSIYLDWNMDVWACTANGLARYDYEKGIFCRVPISDSVHSVEIIEQISKEYYLVSTREETYCYDRTSGKIWKYLLNGHDVGFYSIYVEGGDVVAGTVKGKELIALSYENEKLVQRHPSLKMPFNIASILRAESGKYWIGLAKGGLYLVDLKAGTMSKTCGFVPESLSVEALTYDDSGRLWIGTGDGLYVYDPNSTSVLKLQSDNSPLSLSHDAVKSLYRDRSGGIWIGTEYGGVNYWSGKNESFHALDYSDLISKNDRIVTAMCMDDDRSLWIGTRHGGLNHHYIIDGHTVTYDIDNIRSVLSTKDMVYVGTSITGWKILDKVTGKCRSFVFPSDVNDFLEMDDGRILIGSLSGLYVYDRKNGISDKLKVPEDGRGVRILCLHKDSKGVFWIGAKEGIRRFAFGKEREPEEVNGNLPSHIVQVQCLHESRDSLMWIGTADGLFSYRLSDGYVSYVTGVPGLHQITIKGIEEDQTGNLWISTDSGLTRYDPATGDNRTYYVGDGLQSNQFNAYSSHCSDMYGNLYFGGVGGITWFDPSALADNHDTYPPIITGLRLFNVDVKAGDRSEILSKDISLTDAIELQHDQNSITLSFACPDYASAGRNSFRYKMEGVDNEWIDARGRSVTYSNLTHGNYRFRLMSANSAGVWSEDEEVLSVRVRPVWYETILAKVLFILLAMSALLQGLYRVKKNFDRRNAERIDRIRKIHEEDIRRTRVALYVTDPYILKQGEVEFIESVLTNIDNNVSDSIFSVEALASLMNMTRANLHLKTKKITGMSPIELIRRIRVETASRFIREGRLSLLEVSERSGFNSSSYFSVTFKKVAGCTPSEYASKFSKRDDI